MIDTLQNCQLCQTEGDIPLETSDECRDVALALAAQAHRSLYIMGWTLDPRLYDSAEFNQAVRNVATAHPNSHVKVLVRDPDTLIKRGHRLIDLSRRLSTRIEIRKLPEDYADRSDAYLVADGRGVLFRKDPERYEGIAAFNDPMRARELMHSFDEVWRRSQQFREFRRLHV